MVKKETLLKKALELYNLKGIEGVGMRELAEAAGMQFGNFTYHFPVKEDVISSIWKEFEELNKGVWMESFDRLRMTDDIDFDNFFEMVEENCRNQMKYKCIWMGMVHIMNQYPELGKGIKKVEEEKKVVIEKWLLGLMKNKFLKKLPFDRLRVTKNDVAFLSSCIDLILRFWISEGVMFSKKNFKVAGRHQITGTSETRLGQRGGEEKQAKYCITMIRDLILPYCTAKGREKING